MLKRFAASKPGGWIYINVLGKVDPFILRKTNGRVSLSIGYPVLLLRHTGAKSGAERETALLFTPDGPRIVPVAVYQTRTDGRRIPVMVLERV